MHQHTIQVWSLPALVIEQMLCRLLRKALRGWVLWWYHQASGMLIAARHRQLVAATALHALKQHAQQRRKKYTMWRAAARQRLHTVFTAFQR